MPGPGGVCSSSTECLRPSKLNPQHDSHCRHPRNPLRFDVPKLKESTYGPVRKVKSYLGKHKVHSDYWTES